MVPQAWIDPGSECAVNGRVCIVAWGFCAVEMMALSNVRLVSVCEIESMYIELH